MHLKEATPENSGTQAHPVSDAHAATEVITEIPRPKR